MKKALFALLLTSAATTFCAQIDGVRDVVNQLKATGATREALINRVQESCTAGDISQAEADALVAELSAQ
ncbi:MAG: hypothetical protein UV38_C0001G0075 [candidate division TM6 bacterium GW2011_GWE2_42_60]|nr:MAG: hypothetical protein UV38_C0001G0075 [candidate division TM6 bacterium GW2011_GWE2_42_60]HBY05730.1 hypothetical protein [Candidatus Dependentiae bacterium]